MRIVGFSSSNDAVAAIGGTFALAGVVLAVLALATSRYFHVPRTSD